MDGVVAVSGIIESFCSQLKILYVKTNKHRNRYEAGKTKTQVAKAAGE